MKFTEANKIKKYNVLKKIDPSKLNPADADKVKAQSLGLINWNNTASENLNGRDLLSPFSI